VLLAAAIGVVGGVLSGVFGVGGGIVFVPGLVLFAHLGQLDAQATSLVAIVPVALVGARRQQAHGNVSVRDGCVLGAGSALGVGLGVGLADALPARVLRLGFAALILLVAFQLVRSARRAPTPAAE